MRTLRATDRQMALSRSRAPWRFPLAPRDWHRAGDGTLDSFLQFVRYVEADVFGERPLLRAWDERVRAAGVRFGAALVVAAARSTAR